MKGLADLWTTLPNVGMVGKQLSPNNTRYTYLMRRSS